MNVSVKDFTELLDNLSLALKKTVFVTFVRLSRYHLVRTMYHSAEMILSDAVMRRRFFSWRLIRTSIAKNHSVVELLYFFIQILQSSKTGLWKQTLE